MNQELKVLLKEHKGILQLITVETSKFREFMFPAKIFLRK